MTSSNQSDGSSSDWRTCAGNALELSSELLSSQGAYAAAIGTAALTFRLRYPVEASQMPNYSCDSSSVAGGPLDKKRRSFPLVNCCN
ncbi:hypothetical protein OKW29_007386 [Paraburkholderia sp. CI3]